MIPSLRRTRWIWAACLRRSGGVSGAPAATPSACSSGSRAPNVLSARHEAAPLLRHRGAGGDHPAGGRSWAKMVQSLFEPAPGPGSGRLPAPFLEPCCAARWWRAAVSGAVAEDGDDRRWIQRRRSRRNCAAPWDSNARKNAWRISRALRAGMASNGITGAVQQTIVHSITAFALYGFFRNRTRRALPWLAYASAYLKCHYCGVHLRHAEQPADGFYSSAVLIKRRAAGTACACCRWT